MKSAMAEELLLALCLKEPHLLENCRDLREATFSSQLLGRVFTQLMRRYREGLEVSLSGLTDFEPEEMSHIAGIVQRQQGPVNEQALMDCVQTIQREYQARSEVDLRQIQQSMQKSKGIKG